MNTNLLSSRKAKKSVRFNQLVHVTPFERASSTEAKDIWFTNSDMAEFKAQGRELADLYRKLGVVQVHDSDPSTYRGFESCTRTRQRQRLLSNRCAVYAHKKGMDELTTAAMYQQCNTWSSEVAFVQAIHDYNEIYHINNNNNNNNNSTDAITQARAATLNRIPSVAFMVPPPALPFAVQSALVLQQLRQNNKRRNISSASAVATAVDVAAPARHVRQRIC